jgi:tetratricopeptide (TPR) repeat protein
MGLLYDEMGSTYRRQGGYPQAIEYYRKSLDNSQQIGDGRQLAVGCGNLGIVYQEQGDFCMFL